MILIFSPWRCRNNNNKIKRDWTGPGDTDLEQHEARVTSSHRLPASRAHKTQRRNLFLRARVQRPLPSCTDPGGEPVLWSSIGLWVKGFIRTRDTSSLLLWEISRLFYGNIYGMKWEDFCYVEQTQRYEPRELFKKRETAIKWDVIPACFVMSFSSSSSFFFLNPTYCMNIKINKWTHTTPFRV